MIETTRAAEMRALSNTAAPDTAGRDTAGRDTAGPYSADPDTAGPNATGPNTASKSPDDASFVTDAVLTLHDLGWDDQFEASYREFVDDCSDDAKASRLRPGRVVRRDATACQVWVGGAEAQASIASHLLADPLTAPTTGDFVVLAGDQIASVLERRTTIMRGSFRDLSAQALAANVDFVVVVSSLANELRARRLERLLVVAWQTGAVPVVVLTKADCCADTGAASDQVRALAPGSAVHVVSAVTGDGLDGLAADLAPRSTAVMIGPSGVGKSTLTNALGGGDLATRNVRADGKGRHTTVTRELVRLANGALMIDTPGLRAVSLWDAEDALGDAFSDVADLAASCRFNDCAHATEPGCAVNSAVTSGDLDRARLESYKKLQKEQRWLAARNDARLRAQRTAEWRAISKGAKRIPHH